ncbi:MAG: DNA-directed RNA polymerase subunit E'' [Nanoarchaeota archaeon]|nr:DNA-directed RNA polymerase subunit E'' [Nanoarchaeota archaeon]
MAKLLANKNTKELLTDVEIKEKRLNIGEFIQTWKGRVVITDAKRSHIAQKMGIEKDGEYAIKVR